MTLPNTNNHIVAYRDFMSWYAKVYTEYLGYYVPISSCPAFDNPRKAIAWGQMWVGDDCQA